MLLKGWGCGGIYDITYLFHISELNVYKYFIEEKKIICLIKKDCFETLYRKYILPFAVC